VSWTLGFVNDRSPPITLPASDSPRPPTRQQALEKQHPKCSRTSIRCPSFPSLIAAALLRPARLRRRQQCNYTPLLAHAERAAQTFQYPARCKSPMNASWLLRISMLALRAQKSALTNHSTAANEPKTIISSPRFIADLIFRADRCCLRMCGQSNGRPRESVPAAKFLIASEPAAYCGFRRHPGVRTDGPKAFTVEEPKADRHSNLGIITGQTAAFGRVYQGS